MIGVVNSVMESGLVITLLCLDSSKSRDIDELRISVSFIYFYAFFLPFFATDGRE